MRTQIRWAEDRKQGHPQQRNSVMMGTPPPPPPPRHPSRNLSSVSTHKSISSTSRGGLLEQPPPPHRTPMGSVAAASSPSSSPSCPIEKNQLVMSQKDDNESPKSVAQIPARTTITTSTTSGKSKSEIIRTKESVGIYPWDAGSNDLFVSGASSVKSLPLEEKDAPSLPTSSSEFLKVNLTFLDITGLVTLEDKSSRWHGAKKRPFPSGILAAIALPSDTSQKLYHIPSLPLHPSTTAQHHNDLVGIWDLGSSSHASLSLPPLVTSNVPLLISLIYNGKIFPCGVASLKLSKNKKSSHDVVEKVKKLKVQGAAPSKKWIERYKNSTKNIAVTAGDRCILRVRIDVVHQNNNLTPEEEKNPQLLGTLSGWHNHDDEEPSISLLNVMDDSSLSRMPARANCNVSLNNDSAFEICLTSSLISSDNDAVSSNEIEHLDLLSTAAESVYTNNKVQQKAKSYYDEMVRKEKTGASNISTQKAFGYLLSVKQDLSQKASLEEETTSVGVKTEADDSSIFSSESGMTLLFRETTRLFSDTMENFGSQVLPQSLQTLLCTESNQVVRKNPTGAVLQPFALSITTSHESSLDEILFDVQNRMDDLSTNEEEQPQQQKIHRPSSSDSNDSYNSEDDEMLPSEMAKHFQGAAGTLLSDRYVIVRDVGRGTFGRVVACVDMRQPIYNGDEVVAIKIVRDDQKDIEAAQIEADILWHVNYRSDTRGTSLCVKMLNHFDYLEGRHYCLVFESLGLSLYDFMKNHSFQPFPLKCVQDFSHQLLNVLEFLHGMHLIHTDLKPENILLISNKVKTYTTTTKNGQIINSSVPASTRIKLIDFGGATFEDEHKSAVINTKEYRAPEVILKSSPWSYPSDLWSLGCILVELYTGEVLFPAHNKFEHLALIDGAVGPFPNHMLDTSQFVGALFDSHRREQSLPPLQGITIKEEDQALGLLYLFAQLLVIDPCHRATATEALNYSFVKDCQLSY